MSICGRAADLVCHQRGERYVDYLRLRFLQCDVIIYDRNAYGATVRGLVRTQRVTDARDERSNPYIAALGSFHAA